MESDYVEVKQYEGSGMNLHFKQFEYDIFAAKEVITVDAHTCTKIVVCLCV